MAASPRQPRLRPFARCCSNLRALTVRTVPSGKVSVTTASKSVLSKSPSRLAGGAGLGRGHDRRQAQRLRSAAGQFGQDGRNDGEPQRAVVVMPLRIDLCPAVVEQAMHLLPFRHVPFLEDLPERDRHVLQGLVAQIADANLGDRVLLAARLCRAATAANASPATTHTPTSGRPFMALLPFTGMMEKNSAASPRRDAERKSTEGFQQQILRTTPGRCNTAACRRERTSAGR